MAERTTDEALDAVIRLAQQRVRTSLADADSLLAVNPSAAYVWAVRSMEIFAREVMLLPMFVDDADGNVAVAIKRAKRVFGSGNFEKALQRFEARYGALDTMLTEDDLDAWAVWVDVARSRRGEIVHGVDEATLEDAQVVLDWTKQMVTQLTLRIVTTDGHPSNAVLRGILDSIRKPDAPT